MKVIITTPYSKALTRTGTVVGTCKRKQLTCTVIQLDNPTHHTGCSTFIMRTNEDVAYISNMCKLGMIYNTHEAAAKHGLAMRIVTKESV